MSESEFVDDIDDYINAYGEECEEDCSVCPHKDYCDERSNGWS